MSPVAPLQLQDRSKLPDAFERWLGSPAALPTSNLLFAHAQDVHERTGIPVSSALAIANASLSAVIGPSLRVENPIGAPLAASINVLSIDRDRGIRRGLDLSLHGFMSGFNERLDHRMGRGEKGRQCEIRAAQCDFEERHKAASQIAARSDDSEGKDPKAVKAFQEREAARRRLLEAKFTERPRILAEQLRTRDLDDFIAKSFDRALLYYPRNVDELVAEPEIVHEFLLAGWYGRVCEITPGECCSPAIANIWLGVSPAMAGAAIDSPLTSLLATFFVLRSGDRGLRLTGAGDRAAWKRLTAGFFAARIAGSPSLWKLSPGAVGVFEKVCNELCDMTGGLSEAQKRLTELWPEQLLKLALLCALMAPDIDTSATINKAIVEQAATVLRMLGREQLLHHPMLQPAAAKLDSDIAGALAKVQLHGPMSKRDLCRRYHNRRVDELELLLARASELGVLTIINGNVQILNGQMPVSVSACQQATPEISQTHENAR